MFVAQRERSPIQREFDSNWSEEAVCGASRAAAHVCKAAVPINNRILFLFWVGESRGGAFLSVKMGFQVQGLSSNTIGPLQVIRRPMGRQRVIDNLLTFHGENRRRAESELGCTSLVQHVDLVPAFCLHNVSVSGRAGPAVTSCCLSRASPPPRPPVLGNFSCVSL